jgi:hypothetical protein
MGFFRWRNRSSATSSLPALHVTPIVIGESTMRGALARSAVYRCPVGTIFTYISFDLPGQTGSAEHYGRALLAPVAGRSARPPRFPHRSKKPAASHLHNVRAEHIMSVRDHLRQQAAVSGAVDIGGCLAEEVGCDAADLSRWAR